MDIGEIKKDIISYCVDNPGTWQSAFVNKQLVVYKRNEEIKEVRNGRRKKNQISNN